MCIGIPCQLIEVNGMWGIVDYCGNKREVALSLLPAATPGAWVLIHAGLAIQLIDEVEAKQTLWLLKELERDE